jgi:hypothetical protein
MNSEARFRRRRPHPPRPWGTRAGHGQGHARPRTASKEWLSDRPPLPYGPGRAPPGPGTAASTRKTTSRPKPQPRPSREKPASRHQVPQAHQRTARSPSSSPGTPPPLGYSPAPRDPPPTRAPGRHTTRRRQAGPSTGRRAQDRYIPTPPATASRTRPPQPASASHRQPRRTASRDRNPARTIPIGLDLFHDWSRP